MTVTDVAARQEAETDEASLVEAARHDYAAFERLYRRYVTRVYRYCLTHTSNARDAEDLTAQTFVAALEGIKGYRGRGSFAAWLFSIAWRKCKDHHRRRYKIQQESLDNATELPDVETPDPEQRAQRQEILACIKLTWPYLSEDRRDVIRLRFWAGLNTAETAKVMGRSRGAVKMLLSRAIKDLRERCLDE
ncbi:MAG TPA: RNA polymerase sigma factor [Candidatus Sulfomarinibacteraceae bacterium]|nr:RNA polymerase sigma factor [Candidatus Sulfomarinibacteraceae bacterium]